MDTKPLKQIGLSENEIKVYLELLKEDNAPASEIAQKCGINRSLTYEILDGLCKRGLVGFFEQNKLKYFKAVHPSKLLSILKEYESNIQTILPKLLSFTKSPKKKYSVELFEGKEGLKTIMQDVLTTNPKIFVDITSGRTTELLTKLYLDKWHKQRAKQGMIGKFLLNDTQEGRRRATQIKNFKLTQAKFLPVGLKAPTHIYVYANKVAIMLWVKDFPFAILIENQEVADRFAEFFDWFWKISK